MSHDRRYVVFRVGLVRWIQRDRRVADEAGKLVGTTQRTIRTRLDGCW